MDFMNFILEQNLVIIAVVYILGMFIKKLEMIPDKFIPFILLVIATVFSLLTNDITNIENIANAVMQGILVAGAAVLTNQIVKQTKK